MVHQGSLKWRLSMQRKNRLARYQTVFINCFARFQAAFSRFICNQTPYKNTSTPSHTKP